MPRWLRVIRGVIGTGLLSFALIGVNGFRVWSAAEALVNLAALTVLGG